MDCDLALLLAWKDRRAFNRHPACVHPRILRLVSCVYHLDSVLDLVTCYVVAMRAEFTLALVRTSGPHLGLSRGRTRRFQYRSPDADGALMSW